MKITYAVKITLRIILSFFLLIKTFGCSASETSEPSTAEQDRGEVLKIKPGDAIIDPSNIKSCIVDWGRFNMTIRTAKFNDKPIFSVKTEIPSSQGIMIDHIGIDAKTLQLIYRHTPYFAVGANYLVANIADTHLTGSLNPIMGGTPIIIDTKLESPVFEEAITGLMLSSLPLEEGFKVQIPRLGVRKADKSFYTHWITCTVKKREMLKIKGESYDCFVVEVDYMDIPYKEQLWITKEAPYVVRKKSRSTTQVENVTMIDCCL